MGLWNDLKQSSGIPMELPLSFLMKQISLPWLEWNKDVNWFFICNDCHLEFSASLRVAQEVLGNRKLIPQEETLLWGCPAGTVHHGHARHHSKFCCVLLQSPWNQFTIDYRESEALRTRFLETGED